MDVRDVEPEELDEAGRVTALAWRELASPGDEGWEHYLRELANVAGRVDRTTVLVAVLGRRILGTATIELDHTIDGDDDLGSGRANLRMLGVDPEARGLGAGRALVQASIDRARAAGKLVLTLMTTPRMQAAISLYESMGFDRAPDADHHGEDGFVLLAYRLAL